MRRVIRRGLAAGTLALVLAAGIAMGAVPEGPRLAVIKLGAKSPRGLLTVNENGGHPMRLVEGGWGKRSRPLLDFFFPLSWSPDGERVAFSGIVGFRNGDGSEAIEKLFTVRGDGSGLRAIRGTNGGTGPVFSPDGRTVAFTRSVDREGQPTTVGGKLWEEGFVGASIWTVDLLTGDQRQLTPWRPGLRYTASSFSPDGTTLLATLEGSPLLSKEQPVALALDGSGSRPVFNDGFSPVYSPDGSKIALVRRIEDYSDDLGENTDLFVLNADGTGLRRLTRTPGQPELYPSWDPSGERLAYVRLPLVRSENAPFGHRTGLMQVNADGSCQTEVISARVTFFFAPAWQPGPGREAGRIEC
jgi:dipeptidyl aminopeptidase/acylaminoacyl peptidase